MKLRYALLALPLAAGFAVAGASLALAQGTQLFAVLLGGNETAAGDPDGYGAASVTFHGRDTICVGLVVDRITKPSLAHIHKEKAGAAGGVVIDFAPDIPATGNPGHSSLCKTKLDPVLLSDIQKNPNEYYVNVHNGDFPGGAIRGQLF